MALAPLSAAATAGVWPQRRALASRFAHGYDRSMRVALVALGALVILGGLVWIAQGLNLPFAPRSFMSADRTWIVIGAAAVLVGTVIAGRGWRRD